MGISAVRVAYQDRAKWGVFHDDQIVLLENESNSLAVFLATGVDEARSAYGNARLKRVQVSDVRFLSPVTTPTRLLCQGTNYATHRAEAGLSATRPPFNLFFSKGDSSICGPYDDVVRPSHVAFLDYEVELGLVIGQPITSPIDVTSTNLHQFIAGFVMFNDISARDVQFLEGQWFKGKSYRTFGPTGPILYLMDADESRLVHNLHVTLSVNDEVRQDANTSQLLYKPEETLSELSRIMDLSIGDVLVTGTPGGVALQLSSEEMDQLTSAGTPYETKRQILSASQSQRPYLRDGDVIRAEIRSDDGRISLGTQVTRVVSAGS